MSTTNLDDDALAGLLESLKNDIHEFKPNDLFDAKGGMNDVSDDMHVLEPAYELGREMVLIRRPEDLCLGIVAKTRVCVDDSKTCTYANHRQHKFNTPFGDKPFLAIIGPKSKNGALTFYKEPLLPVEGVGEDLVNHLLAMESKDGELSGVINMIIQSKATDLHEFKNSRNLLRTVRKCIKISKTPHKMGQRKRIELLMGQLSSLQSQLGDTMGAQVSKDVTKNLLELGQTDAGVFPYLSYRPWELKRSPKLLELGSQLHELWKTNSDTEGHLLRELWSLSRKLRNMLPILASKVLRGRSKSSISRGSARKRRRDKMEKEKGQESVQARKRRQ